VRVLYVSCVGVVNDVRVLCACLARFLCCVSFAGVVCVSSCALCVRVMSRVLCFVRVRSVSCASRDCFVRVLCVSCACIGWPLWALCCVRLLFVMLCVCDVWGLLVSCVLCRLVRALSVSCPSCYCFVRVLYVLCARV
jgi:hypothetical protein